MLLVAGSVVLAVLNQAVTFALSQRWRWGWIALGAAQVPNSVYDVATRQYGFLAVSGSSVWIAVRAWRRWAPAAGR